MEDSDPALVVEQMLGLELKRLGKGFSEPFDGNRMSYVLRSLLSPKSHVFKVARLVNSRDINEMLLSLINLMLNEKVRASVTRNLFDMDVSEDFG